VKEYRCKYDKEGHGTFPDPGTLGRHYVEAHPNHVKAPAPVSKKIYTCRYCGEEFKWPGNVRSHVISRHPERVDSGVPYHREDHSDVRAADAPPAGRSVVRHKAVPQEQHVWTVDDIVMPVLTQVSKPGDVVALAKLPSIFEWRDATAKMLNELQ
jgi:hypothetical protein